MVINNMDVAMLVHKFRRARMEVVKSVSSNSNTLREADKTRFLAYLADIKQAIAHFNGQPELDLPEWTPADISVGEPEQVPPPENEALLHMSNILEAAEVEIVHSQSARQGAGLISHDAGRVSALMDKLEDFINGYMSNQLPLDYPESSPLRDSTGAGRKLSPSQRATTR